MSSKLVFKTGNRIIQTGNGITSPLSKIYQLVQSTQTHRYMNAVVALGQAELASLGEVNTLNRRNV